LNRFKYELKLTLKLAAGIPHALHMIMPPSIERQIAATMGDGDLEFWKIIHHPIIYQRALRQRLFQWLSHRNHLIMRPHPRISAPGWMNKDRGT
jgi:hypothetical protein